MVTLRLKGRGLSAEFSSSAAGWYKFFHLTVESQRSSYQPLSLQCLMEHPFYCLTKFSPNRTISLKSRHLMPQSPHKMRFPLTGLKNEQALSRQEKEGSNFRIDETVVCRPCGKSWSKRAWAAGEGWGQAWLGCHDSGKSTGYVRELCLYPIVSTSQWKPFNRAVAHQIIQKSVHQILNRDCLEALINRIQ